ncbi:MAG: DUF1013 domain-containing protein [Holosporales bacterium]|nr:DUF1013 domain-containing protein [Holosporales bacterium]
MPKATAIWLVENTALTFQQIADFCGLHFLEVESIANGDLDSKMTGFNPIVSSQLTLEEINRCENDSDARLQLKDGHYLEIKPTSRKYTPKVKRQDKPDAIAWLLKYYPDVSEHDICDLIGTTKATIRAIKNKTHKNISTIKPRSPVSLGLCSESDLDFVVAKLARS